MKKKNFNNENFNSFLKKFQNLLKKKFYVKKEYFIVLKGRVDSICCSLYIFHDICLDQRWGILGEFWSFENKFLLKMFKGKMERPEILKLKYLYTSILLIFDELLK